MRVWWRGNGPDALDGDVLHARVPGPRAALGCTARPAVLVALQPQQALSPQGLLQL